MADYSFIGLGIMTDYRYEELGCFYPCETKYRHPYIPGKRSPVDTPQVARLQREAAVL